MRHGHSSSDDIMQEWIDELERLLYNDVILNHIHSVGSVWWHNVNGKLQFKTYDEYRAETDELIAEEPYSILYVYWLMSKIDLQARDDDYDRSNALFEQALDNFKRWYKRTHRSAGVQHIKTGGFYKCL